MGIEQNGRASAGRSTLGAVLWLSIELDTLDGCVAAVLSQLKIKSLSAAAQQKTYINVR